eukprot:scaffold140544_cov20-Tisochrysis_lutea.AAC.1
MHDCHASALLTAVMHGCEHTGLRNARAFLSLIWFERSLDLPEWPPPGCWTPLPPKHTLDLF